MKKQNTIGRGSLWAVLLFATVISSCKKEKAEELPVDPVGFWRGNVYLYRCAVLNMPNGTSRFYFQIPGGDTALSTEKYDGSYIMEANSFRGTYNLNNGSPNKWLIEADDVSQLKMTGFVSSYGGASLPFEFKKQQ